MENSLIFANVFIYVCSRNPIASWVISNLLGKNSLTWHAPQFFAGPPPIVLQKVNISLFDVSSVPEWPVLIPKWTSAGCKSILLVAEDWIFRGTQLRAFHLGAAGIVGVAPEFGQRLLDAITRVASGQLFAIEGTTIKRHVGHHLPKPLSSISPLSFREEQVMDLLILGFSNRRIGKVLGITERTAKFHVSNILHKRHVRSRGELANPQTNPTERAPISLP